MRIAEIIDGSFWFDDLEIGIGTWHGSFKGFTRLWLRWYDTNEDLKLADSERIKESGLNRQQNTGIQVPGKQMEDLERERIAAARG